MDLRFRDSDKEVFAVFELIDFSQVKTTSTKKGQPSWGDIVIRYRLRDDVATVDSMRVIASIAFEVETGPLFSKTDPSNPEDEVLVNAEGRRVWIYGSYDYDDYSYPDATEEDRHKADELRKASFDRVWKESLSE